MDRFVISRLKSHRHDQGFEDSLTRSDKRIEILQVVNALAAFASWLAGLARETLDIVPIAPPIHAQALFGPSPRTRSIGQIMIHRADITMAGTPDIPAGRHLLICRCPYEFRGDTSDSDPL